MVPAGCAQINIAILPGRHFEPPAGGVETYRKDEIGDGNIHAGYFYDRELAHERTLFLVSNWVAQNTEAFNLHFDNISRLHPQRRCPLHPHTARSAGENHITTLKTAERRAVLNDGRHVKDHLAQSGVLHGLAVQPGCDPKVPQVTQFIRRHHPRSEASGLRKVFARRELMRVVLPVPDTSV